ALRLACRLLGAAAGPADRRRTVPLAAQPCLCVVLAGLRPGGAGGSLAVRRAAAAVDGPSLRSRSAARGIAVPRRRARARLQAVRRAHGALPAALAHFSREIVMGAEIIPVHDADTLRAIARQRHEILVDELGYAPVRTAVDDRGAGDPLDAT